MKVPKSTLEARGFVPGEGRELVKLLVSWSSEDRERLEDVFANYYPGDRRAEVYLGKVGNGESEFRLVGATRYAYADFVKDFGNNRPLSLVNMNLGVNDGAVWMDVDGRRIVLLECLMNTFGSMVNLRGKLAKDGPEIKFEFDGKSAVVRLKGRPTVEYMQVHGDELEIRYAQSKDEKHFYRMNLKSG